MGRLEADDQMKWIIACAAAVLSGAAGAMGLGGGSVLLIYLTVFAKTNQITAQGINLLFFLPIAACSVIIYSIRKQIKWRKIFLLIIFGTLGGLIGSILVSFIEVSLLRKFFGAGILLYGLFQIFSKRQSAET